MMEISIFTLFTIKYSTFNIFPIFKCCILGCTLGMQYREIHYVKKEEFHRNKNIFTDQNVSILFIQDLNLRLNFCIVVYYSFVSHMI